jgi:hypothetical protein
MAEVSRTGLPPPAAETATSPDSEVVQFLSRCFATSSFTLPVGNAVADFLAAGREPSVFGVIRETGGLAP